MDPGDWLLWPGEVQARRRDLEASLPFLSPAGQRVAADAGLYRVAGGGRVRHGAAGAAAGLQRAVRLQPAQTPQQDSDCLRRIQYSCRLGAAVGCTALAHAAAVCSQRAGLRGRVRAVEAVDPGVHGSDAPADISAAAKRKVRNRADEDTEPGIHRKLSF